MWKYSLEGDNTAFSEEFGFSNPGIPLGKSVQPLLEGRSCTLLQFCPSDPLILISGHGASYDDQVSIKSHLFSIRIYSKYLKY